MIPIEVENSHDCTVSIQIVSTEITDHTGTRKGPDEICLLIEDEKGDHLALFTPSQADELIRALRLPSDQITGETGRKRTKQSNKPGFAVNSRPISWGLRTKVTNMYILQMMDKPLYDNLLQLFGAVSVFIIPL